MLMPSAINFLGSLMSGGLHREIYTVAYINKAKEDEPPQEFFAGTIDEITRLTQKKFYKSLDYYISINPSKNHKRDAASTCAVKAIMIDVDCHDTLYSADTIRDTVWTISSLWQDDNTIIPAPNFIVQTGRGLQLWWLFRPNLNCPYYVNKLNAVRQVLICQISQILRATNSPYHVDPIASNKLQGLARLPGSYNSITKTLVTCEYVFDGRYDLHREYDNFVAANLIVPSKKVGPDKKGKRKIVKSNLAAFSYFRVDLLYRARELMDRPAGDELRDIFCHLVYCGARAAHSHEGAMRIVEEFNQGFHVPLTGKELNSYLSTSKVKAYKYRDETLRIRLGLMEEEFYSLKDAQKAAKRKNSHEKRDILTKERKEARNVVILEAYEKCGTYSGAAKATGYDRRTVRACVEAYAA